MRGVVNWREMQKTLLKVGDSCLFLVNPYIHWAGENECEDGYVSAIYENGALLHYMYGVSSYSDTVKFEDIMIIGDPDNSELGEQFKIPGFSGRGIVLNRKVLK